MRQSQTYRRGKGIDIDPNSYHTYRTGVAGRIIYRRRGRISMADAWQLAAIPAFFLWLFRRPINFFKRRRMDRKLRKKLESNSKSRSTE